MIPLIGFDNSSIETSFGSEIHLLARISLTMLFDCIKDKLSRKLNVAEFTYKKFMNSESTEN